VGPFEGGDNFSGAASRVKGNQQITISTIATEYPPQTMRDWPDVVEEVMDLPSANPTPCSVKQAILVIEGVLKACSVKGKLKFNGTTHCEAILALLIKSGYPPVSGIAIITYI
jgi:hypothetical protein